MISFENFLRCHNNKDIILKFEAEQELIAFDLNKINNMLKLGFVLPELANTCVNISKQRKNLILHGER